MPASVCSALSWSIIFLMIWFLVHVYSIILLDSGYLPGSGDSYSISCSWIYDELEDCDIYRATDCSRQDDVAVSCVGMYTYYVLSTSGSGCYNLTLLIGYSMYGHMFISAFVQHVIEENGVMELPNVTSVLMNVIVPTTMTIALPINAQNKYPAMTVVSDPCTGSA